MTSQLLPNFDDPTEFLTPPAIGIEWLRQRAAVEDFRQRPMGELALRRTAFREVLEAPKLAPFVERNRRGGAK